MEKLIQLVETMKPFFEKVSNNPYLRAIRDGFVSCIPVVLFSSLFILVACVPEIFGFKWPDNISAVLWQAYGYTMGILAILMVATIAKSLTELQGGEFKLYLDGDLFKVTIEFKMK